ncbi:hypothetical protein BDW67DRAFT_186113 [Aspergillus spinulosporus]
MAESEIDYVLTRDILDNNRLNLQHYLWIELFQYHIHPSVAIDNSSVLRIADVGTGTGIWLTDLARRLPCTAVMDGLDISLEAAPPAGCLPSNVAFYQYDIHSNAPDRLRGIYDIVHVRNFSLVLKNTQIEQAIRNLMQLLKPGGYLQWGEPDVSSLRIEQTAPGTDISALNELTELTLGMDARLRPTWVPSLPKLFETCGLGDVLTDIRDAPPHLALANHECNLVMHELIARKTRSTAVGQRLAALMPQAMQETRAGAFWAFTRWTVVGRKAA